MEEIKFRGLIIQLPENVIRHQKNKPTTERFKDGSYEKLEIDTLLPYVNEDSVIINLGGSVGGLACVINNHMANKENMVVVEANPDLINTLENNRDINNLMFHIEHAAVAGQNKEVSFNFNGLSLSGSIHRKKWLEGNKWGEYKNVKMKTLTPLDIESKYGMKFNTLSCDIEGEELNLLIDMFDYFKDFKVMVVEFHDWPTIKNAKQRRHEIEKKYSTYFDVTNLGHSTRFVRKQGV